MLGVLETAAADTLGELAAGGHAASDPTGGACPNCGSILRGRYCHDCGQNADTHKRSILHLAWEAVEGLFHFDGRLMRTLPDLFLRPGRLAGDYMEGRIARHVPPFRTFLVALLLFIFAAEHAIHGLVEENHRQETLRAAMLATPRGRAAEAARLRVEADGELDSDLTDAANDRREDIGEADADRAAVEATYAKAVAEARARHAVAERDADRLAAGLPAEKQESTPNTGAKSRRTAARPGSWWRDGLRKATGNPEYYLSVLFTWGHRAAVLLLPIVGLTLALVYRNKPRFFLYDHLLVAMNLLSFAFLTNALGFVAPDALRPWWLGAVAIWTPINLFQTLRGAYGSSLVGAALKTLAIWTTTVLAFGVLVVALMLFSLAQI